MLRLIIERYFCNVNYELKIATIRKIYTRDKLHRLSLFIFDLQSAIARDSGCFIEIPSSGRIVIDKDTTIYLARTKRTVANETLFIWRKRRLPDKKTGHSELLL